MKLVWEQFDYKNRLILIAKMQYDNNAITPTGLCEEDLIPVQAWCVENECGERISFDMFRFRNRKELTLFLLRWS